MDGPKTMFDSMSGIIDEDSGMRFDDGKSI